MTTKHCMTARARTAHWAAALAFVCACLLSPLASAQPAGVPPEMAHAGVTEHLDGQLPLDTTFRDHTGKSVKLRDFFDGKRPVVLTFAYHSCPQLCSMVLNALTTGLRDVAWTAGKEFDVVTISIDPHESLEKTANKRASLLAEYKRLVPEGQGWHFLVGDESQIAAVATAAGFESQYDADQKQWAHPSVVMIATPDGKMARYLYGIEFPSGDLKLGLLEASQGRSITTIEKIILYCYHYDPKGGKYVLVAQRVMRVGGAMVATILIATLALLWMREFRRRETKNENKNDNPSDHPGGGEGVRSVS